MNNNNEKSLPIVYYQLKKIRQFWLNSASEEKTIMIKMLDESLNDILTEYEEQNEIS